MRSTVRVVVVTALAMMATSQSTSDILVNETTSLPTPEVQDVSNSTATSPTNSTGMAVTLTFEPSTESPTTTNASGNALQSPTPLFASENQNDGSTTTVLLSISVGIAAAVAVAILISLRRRNDNQDAFSTSKELSVLYSVDTRRIASRFQKPDNQETSGSQYSVHGLSTGGASAFDGCGVFASTRSSNILNSTRHIHGNTLSEEQSEGESFFHENALKPHLSMVEDEPVDDDAILQSMASSIIYIDNTSTLGRGSPKTLRDSETYIVSYDSDEDV